MKFQNCLIRNVFKNIARKRKAQNIKYQNINIQVERHLPFFGPN